MTDPNTPLSEAQNQTDTAPPSKARWIFESGWRGLCPRCGKGKMFKSWLKVQEHCPECGLDYRFASPDDGPAFFSLCIIAFPLTFLIVWFQVAFDPPIWVHLFTSIPLMGFGCVLPLRPIKGWLVASQYVNKAQEAGTGGLWQQLHGTDDKNDKTPL
ncbi:DUF983 domain-containing protein [Altericroceibacterium endophyticum]|uniref:DUF983 domain-containing protein n=1 Tax=Altericroceibacterium endophyticum TaxID=1808508 RepID=A0A6I4T638_9SPHN|nr:DUF983 domain-containing protein [Altericroceibacterium endophyticum]MXO66138.1 DUF983 domain-containing protein [Altericroceibacterium endophyticum]